MGLQRLSLVVRDAVIIVARGKSKYSKNTSFKRNKTRLVLLTTKT
ncbi:hypothetical protein AHAT_29700 [Agarivorans sp. Toyoura001]|nr:hypothetical protein AHAT_29700 [Agarivorans sp. Toyoura001]